MKDVNNKGNSVCVSDCVELYVGTLYFPINISVHLKNALN